ncbi:uncharacterized protein LOC119075912 isoform X2 [Bradysia coprophila]|uniref:uncharacterized protein LOC119075912 isoform X2 n=1 Tax=Bradysia coprophila TaxID=38358 RepID=UPI00187D8F91|nr:uncharacterized protein LOC119075912 isoform X2 [Bradysia coprophila]
MKALLSIALCIVGAQAWWTEFELTGVDNSEEGIFKTDLKVTRFNKTTYTISGVLEFTDNMEHNYDCEAKSYVSRQGNNQFTLLPYKISRDNCCQFFDSPYFRLIEKELAGNSDLPKRENGVFLCHTFAKGVYTLRPDPFDKNIFVKYVDPGTYRGDITFFNKGSTKISSVMRVYLKLY